ncbi:uncharacterized protein RJT21DRAFT_1005 [Scheffersomyces amazonensis]|uniref:uncharacterized protein n=1 Tax=Scheffersomyces amazonensis TaxID=1078765 RepID=UPI00315C69C7
MSSHNDILREAKINQLNQLKASNQYSKQLTSSIYSLIKSNSSLQSSSHLIDKISTIHQLNDEIDKQLNEDIASNYDRLMYQKKKLNNLINDCHRVLNIHSHNHPTQTVNIITNLQSRSELIDQELRILEYTLKLLTETHSN